MKKLIFLSVLLAILIGSNSLADDGQKAADIATAKEIAKNRARLSFNNVDYQQFTDAEMDKLASGLTVIKKNFRFTIITEMWPLIKIADVYTQDTYSSQAGTVNLVNSETKIGPGNIDTWTSIVFLTSLLLILLSGLISGFILIDRLKIDLTIHIILANMWVITSLIIGWVVSSVYPEALIWIPFTLSLLIITKILPGSSLSKKAVFLAALPVGILISEYSGGLTNLNYDLFGAQMGIIWTYIGAYVITSVISVILLWLKKSPEEAVYIGGQNKN